MKTPKPWECEGKAYSLEEVDAFIDHLREVIQSEIAKVFGVSGYKGRDCPISVYIGNSMTHRVTFPYWAQKAELLETQEEILDEFRCLGYHGMSEESKLLASLLLSKLRSAKEEAEERKEKKAKNLCPVCKEPAVQVCKCPRHDSKCKNGHEWHYCTVHQIQLFGKSDHSISTDTCTCSKDEDSE